MRLGRDFLDRLQAERWGDGRLVPLGLKRRLRREYERLQMVIGQMEQVVAERAHALKTSRSSDVEKDRQLRHLRRIGPNSTWLYVMEFFCLGEFRNRRQVGALAGLVPAPY